MQATQLILLIIAFLLSVALTWFQYFHSTTKGNVKIWLAALRFVALFSLFILLINPKYEKERILLEKQNLILAVDGSKSIDFLKGREAAQEVLAKLQNNTDLSDRFKIKTYLFGGSLLNQDSIVFDKRITNISKALGSLNEVYGNEQNVVILLTDGNQTLGNDFEFQSVNDNTSVLPVALGDTTQYEDIGVTRINVNKYAFLQNEFPVEATFVYNGKKPIKKAVRVYLDDTLVHRETLEFAGDGGAKTIKTLLKASNVGVKRIKLEVAALTNERNKANNTKLVAIEVIDEKTQISIVSNLNHPDIGMLKKSIEANEQRSVGILRPSVDLKELDDKDILILYQPDASFKRIYDFIENKGIGSFTITGTKTDWNSLNTFNTVFTKEDLDQSEDVIPSKNNAFGLFDLATMSFTDFPPLQSSFGDLLITRPVEIIAYQGVKGITLSDPLFFVTNTDNRKQAFLLGEDIWKWRVQAYRNDRSFENFDTFMGKLMLFLSDSEKKERLVVQYNAIYEGAAEAGISASYFDRSYNFDANATLRLVVKSRGTDFEREAPMLLSNSTYKADLSDLDAGTFDFIVQVEGEGLSNKGQFQILEFDLEEQFLAADYRKLERFALRNNSELFYPEETEKMTTLLLDDNRYVPIQKSSKNIVPLIDFRWFLGLIVLSLATEWLVRKYNGLI